MATWQEAAAEVLEEIENLLEWIGTADDSALYGLTNAASELRRALGMDRCAAAPASLAALPAWLCAHDGLTGQAPWGGRLGDGARSYVTNGHAILVVECAADPSCPAQKRWTPEKAAINLAKVLPVATRTHDMIADLSAIGAHRFALCGATILDADILRAFVLPAALAEGGPVRVTWGGPIDAVEFAGGHWTAVVMPRRGAADEDVATLPVIARVSP